MPDLGISGITDAKLIASGGSALVYEALDTDGTEVAVKVLRGIRGSEVARRFEREQSAAERLQEHANIIAVRGTGVSDAGEPYLIMPLMRGGSLADELDDQGRFELQQAVDDIAQASDAIDFAHRRGVLHRDLKPGNLLRTDDGGIVVTDFGIARVVDAGITSATIGATTPLYAAPELLEENEASEQSDVYGLAATLYALLAGAPAFSDSPNIWGTIGRIRSEEPPAIEGVPAPLMRVIKQAMAKRPIDRPVTAEQFRGNLRNAVDAHPDWRPPTPIEQTVRLPSGLGPSPDGPEMVPVVAPPDAELAPTPSTGTQAASNTIPAAEPPTHTRDGFDAPVIAPPKASNQTALRAAAVIGALLLIGGLAWFAVNRALSSNNPTEVVVDRAPPVDTSLPPLTPVPTAQPDAVTEDELEVPDGEPTVSVPVTDGPDAIAAPTSEDPIVGFEGAYFGAYFPEGWSVVRSDVDVGYGFRSQFVANDMYLNIDTTPSELRSGSESILESARQIAATVSSASAVSSETIDDLSLHSFTFRNNRGIPSIDIFFEVNGDGYAIVAGSPTEPERAFAVARQVALSIRSPQSGQ